VQALVMTSRSGRSTKAAALPEAAATNCRTAPRQAEGSMP
jgi:hypothetical protein